MKNTKKRKPLAAFWPSVHTTTTTHDNLSKLTENLTQNKDITALLCADCCLQPYWQQTATTARAAIWCWTVWSCLRCKLLTIYISPPVKICWTAAVIWLWNVDFEKLHHQLLPWHLHMAAVSGFLQICVEEKNILILQAKPCHVNGAWKATRKH